MKKFEKFNVVSTDLGIIEGEGFYKKNEEYIFIDTKDRSIVDFFLKLHKLTLTTIEFSGIDSDAVFSGDFLINTIFHNNNTFMHEVVIKIDKLPKSEQHKIKSEKFNPNVPFSDQREEIYGDMKNPPPNYGDGEE
ncbi:hypothetical protein [Peribacillus butanolivorans]|uniref:hypothetical protein n=1 Tax=Peribacillus butanolivorans TaxID=421767 RepID=UPI0036CC6A5D